MTQCFNGSPTRVSHESTFRRPISINVTGDYANKFDKVVVGKSKVLKKSAKK